MAYLPQNDITVTPTGSITAADVGTTTATGSNASVIYSGTPTTGSSYAVNAVNYNSYSLQVTGTWVGTLQLECSFDNGTTWFRVVPQVKGVSNSAATITANGAFVGEAAAANMLRIRATAWTSGTATISINLSPATEIVRVDNPIRIFDNASNQQATIKPASTASSATDTAVVVSLSPNSSAAAVASSVDYSLTNGTTSPLRVNSQGKLWIYANDTLQVLQNDQSGGGAITANGGSQQVSSAGLGSVIFQIQGTWTGTLQVRGTVDQFGGNGYWQNINSVVDLATSQRVSGTITDASSAVSRTFKVDGSGWQNIQMIATAWTSGTAQVGYRAGAGSVPPIQSGQTTMASSAPVTVASDQVAIPTSNLSVISSNNSTTTPLTGSAVFTGVGEDVTGYRNVIVNVYANVASAANGFNIQFSIDNTNWDTTTNFTVAAATPAKQYVVPITARYFRVKFTNGATAQTGFRLQTILSPQAVQTPDARSVNGNDTAITPMAMMGYDNINAVYRRILTDTVGQFTVTGKSVSTLVTIQASAAQTANNNSTSSSSGNTSRSAQFFLNCTVASGTTPTLNVRMQCSDDGGTTWYDLVYPGTTNTVAFTQLTATGNQSLNFTGCVGDRLRAASIITGTTPSFTYAVKAVFIS